VSKTPAGACERRNSNGHRSYLTQAEEFGYLLERGGLIEKIPEIGNFGAAVQPRLRRCAARSRLASARQKPSHDFLERIALKFLIRIAPTAVKLVFLGRRFGECCNLFLGLSLILRKGHPFANDFFGAFRGLPCSRFLGSFRTCDLLVPNEA
jgi:hypothetical protein